MKNPSHKKIPGKFFPGILDFFYFFIIVNAIVATKKPRKILKKFSVSTQKIPGIICPVVIYVPTAITNPSIARRELRSSASGVNPNFIVLLRC